MNFFEKMFGWHLGKNEGGDYNHIFSIWHILVLIAIIGGIVALCILAKKKDKRFGDKLFKVIAWVLLGLEVLRIIYRSVTYCCYQKYLPDCRNIYNWAEIISFALCTMITYFSIVTLLINKPKWNNFAYDAIFVIALLGGISALVYPDMLNTYYPIYHITNIQTLITHGILVSLPFLLVCIGRLKLNIKNCWKPFVVIVCFAIIARIASVITGSSFMYMNGFELLPGWGDKPLWSYIWILALVFGFWTMLCYLPSVIINAINKKKAHNAQSETN